MLAGSSGMGEGAQRCRHLHSVVGLPLEHSVALRTCAEFRDTGSDLSPTRLVCVDAPDFRRARMVLSSVGLLPNRATTTAASNLCRMLGSQHQIIFLCQT